MRVKIRVSIAIVLLALVVALGGLFGSVGVTARAASSFDESPVLQDLLTATVDGKAFDKGNYPKGAGKPRLISFVEYCFSPRSDVNQFYGLYFYIYNPQALTIEDSGRNKVQLATSYGSDGKPSAYDKYGLTLCSRSEDNLFLKFKLKDRTDKSVLSRVLTNTETRRYDVSGIELLTSGAANAVDYKVGGSWRFSGYSSGCGIDPDAASTLSAKVEELETVDLEVNHTKYRTDMDDTTRTHHNQLNTVYFAIPNDLINRYGYLQKIKAEWFEYKTAPAVVTSSSEAYDALKNYINVSVNKFNTNVPVCVGFQRIKEGTLDVPRYRYNSGFNLITDNETCMAKPYFMLDSTPYSSVPWLFYTQGKPITNYSVSADRLVAYALEYTNKYPDSGERVKDGTISSALFSSDVDAGHTRGYNLKEFDAGDRFDYTGFTSDNFSTWESIKKFFGWQPAAAESFPDVEPIHQVTDVDMKATDLSKTLLIDGDDVDAFRSFYNAAKTADKSTFLFRFSTTDYWTIDAEVYKYGTPTNVGGKQSYPVTRQDSSSKGSYVATQTVFFDWDIISLTFNKDGVMTVIAAVSSPIDIWNDLDAPPQPPNTWKWILAAILLIIVLIVLAPILPLIIKPIVWVICLPFKLIGALFKRSKK